MNRAYITEFEHEFVCSCGVTVVAQTIEDAREAHVVTMHMLEREEEEEHLVN